EADNGDAYVLLTRKPQRLGEFDDGLGPREPACRPTGAQRREARQSHILLGLHASASSSTGTARSTSPAPTVSTTSPGRARLASQRAPCSHDGIQPRRTPARASDTASATIFPRTSPSPSRAAYTSATATTSAAARAAAALRLLCSPRSERSNSTGSSSSARTTCRTCEVHSSKSA